MADDLRTRIATVIARMNDCWCEDCHHRTDEFDLMVADAVIRELGLRQEWRASGNSCVDPQDCPEDARLYGAAIETRYVTEWEPDQ